MGQVIGIIKLAPGEVGFYDELSKIHLTIGRPSAEVYEYMNTTRIVRAIRNKVLVLVAGSLNAARVSSETQSIAQPKKEVKKAEVIAEEPVLEGIIIEETIEIASEDKAEITPQVEEVSEIIQEEVKKVVTTKKKSRK